MFLQKICSFMGSTLTFSFWEKLTENNCIILIRHHNQNFSLYLMEETEYATEE